MKRIGIIFGVLLCVDAIAQTIDWYVDGSVYQTTTCSSGDDITLVTPPAKHGYTFVGWSDENIIIGSWEQDGIPTPENIIYPTFYQNGNLVLRALGSGNNKVADTYNQETGKITRRIGVKVLIGGENVIIASNDYIKSDAGDGFIVVTDKTDNITNMSLCSHFQFVDNYASIWLSTGVPNKMQWNNQQLHINIANDVLGITDYTQESTSSLRAKIMAYLSAQYQNGTPVTVYYVLDTPVEENYVQN